MKLVFKQSQATKGVFSKSVQFSLEAKTLLSSEELARVKKYKMGSELIYTDGRARLGAAQVNEGGSLKAGVWNSLTGLTISVDDIIRGKQINCGEILEMLYVKQTVHESCQQFKLMLEAAANFDGLEEIEL